MLFVPLKLQPHGMIEMYVLIVVVVVVVTLADQYKACRHKY